MDRKIGLYVVYRRQDGEALCAAYKGYEELEWVDMETIENDCREETMSDVEEDFKGFPTIYDFSERVTS